MPTYDYHCDQCGSDFELRLKFSDSIEQTCTAENCDAIARRLFSAVPIVFKGSGWYVNDYGQKASSSGKQSDSSETKSSETKSSETKSSETKSSENKSSENKSSSTKTSDNKSSSTNKE